MNSTLIVSKYTFVELLKSKFYYMAIIIGLIIFLLTSVATSFAYGSPEKVSLDIGLGLLAATNLFISIYAGSYVLSKELEDRSIYLILVRGIDRKSVLIGKVVGLTGALLVNTSILSFFTLGLFLLMGGTFDKYIFWTYMFVLFEGIWISSITILFSLITNQMASIFFTVFMYVIGSSLEQTIQFVSNRGPAILEKILVVLSYLVPLFSKLNLKNEVLYLNSISNIDLFLKISYWCVFFLIINLISIVIFQRKELN